MSDWFDDSEGPDPEYGVFGGKSYISYPQESPQEIARRKAWKSKIDRERRVSHEFNRHMIDLFNRSMKP